MMKQNIGNVDKAIRAAAGFIALGAGFYYQSWWGLVGLVLLATATFKWCPPYALFGVNTYSAEK